MDMAKKQVRCRSLKYPMVAAEPILLLHRPRTKRCSSRYAPATSELCLASCLNLLYLDQSSGIPNKCERQEQRYPSALYRCYFWVASYSVRLSPIPQLRRDAHVDLCEYRSGASLTLAYGRRYGLIGRNGVGEYMCPSSFQCHPTLMILCALFV